MTLSNKKIEQILFYSNEGISDHAISKKLKIDHHTVKKYRIGQFIPKPKSSSTQTSQRTSTFEDDRYINDDGHDFPQEHSQMREYQQQSDNPFTLPKELQEEIHIPFSKLRVGGRLASEMLHEPLGLSPEPNSRPPVQTTYGDFIHVPRSRKPEPQRSDNNAQLLELKQLIQEKKARNDEIAIAGMERDIKRYEERIKRIEEEGRIEREQIQKKADIRREEQKAFNQSYHKPTIPKPEPLPEPEPEIKLSFKELKSRLTGDVLKDEKYYKDQAQHLDSYDQRKLYSEHIRLSYGDEKEEDEDEEEYE